jgi:hypothetical protein
LDGGREEFIKNFGGSERDVTPGASLGSNVGRLGLADWDTSVGDGATDS